MRENGNEGLPADQPDAGRKFLAQTLRSALSVAGVTVNAAKLVLGGAMGDAALATDGFLGATSIILDRACEEVRQETGKEPRPDKVGINTGVTLARNIVGSDSVLQRVWWRVLKRALADTGTGPFLRQKDIEAIGRLNAPEAVLLVTLGPNGTNEFVGEWRKTKAGAAGFKVSEVNNNASAAATLLPLWWIVEKARSYFDSDLNISDEDYLYALDCRSHAPSDRVLPDAVDQPLWTVHRWPEVGRFFESAKTSVAIMNALGDTPPSTFRDLLGIEFTPHARRLHGFVKDLGVPTAADK